MVMPQGKKKENKKLCGDEGKVVFGVELGIEWSRWTKVVREAPNPAAEDGTDGVQMVFLKWRIWVHVPRGERCGGRDFLFQPNH